MAKDLISQIKDDCLAKLQRHKLAIVHDDLSRDRKQSKTHNAEYDNGGVHSFDRPAYDSCNDTCQRGELDRANEDED